ncbi:MAG: hypothetical protein GEU95_17650 [Rhizobiales bacterium]|nr:hypothetical protein [Hyphomicrobiales bacterium]
MTTAREIAASLGGHVLIRNTVAAPLPGGGKLYVMLAPPSFLVRIVGSNLDRAGARRLVLEALSRKDEQRQGELWRDAA